jgi:hypothetical protein
MRHRILAAAILGALSASGCSEYARQGHSPAQLVLVSLLSAPVTSTTVPTTFNSGPLNSDVIVGQTVFNDLGQVTLRLVMRDPGQGTAPATPTPINEVTITGYRVEYRRTDGRNTAGVDVPLSFTGAVTMTVGATTTVTSAFELVRHAAKLEPPLRQLADCVIVTTTPQLIPQGCVILSTIADVTFFGRDQAGNAVSTTGSIQINFANFG